MENPPPHDGHASSDHFNRDVDDPQPLVMRQGGSFAGGAAGNQKVNPRLDLPCQQVAQGGFVDGTVLTEGSYQRCTTSAKLNENKISRMGRLAKPGHRSLGLFVVRRARCSQPVLLR